MTHVHPSPRFPSSNFFLAFSLCVGACAGGTGNATESGQSSGSRAGGTSGSPALEDEGTGGTSGSPAIEDDGTGGTSDGGGGVLEPNQGTGGSAGTEESPATADPGDGDVARCQDAGLEWRTGHKTNYTSWPDPGSEECIEYNGCQWAGYFAHCDGQRSEEWVAVHNIAAVFPDAGVQGHDICIRSGDRTMVVTAIDTCGDSDCDGCCTNNKGDAEALIDLESHTNARWGLADGALQWADLGANGAACEP